ncbi:TPA: hypothetical protein ACQWGQ_001710 [Neisseria subflava]|uniref:hypothetical protein n=1 Tax=unclassified Neisseria TaxID=2623750 RepID=UPI003F7E3599
MKTYPIMLPSHSGEDVQAATLTEYADGGCVIETGSTVTTDHKAAAIDVIKRRWPSAYIAEAVRIEPEAAPEPTLGDLLNLAVRLNSETYQIEVEFFGRNRAICIDTKLYHDTGRSHQMYEIRLDPINPEYTITGQPLSDKIQDAMHWLQERPKQYGNPAA